MHSSSNGQRGYQILAQKAFVDTTILADALLKAGPANISAKRALSCYAATMLPVFAIKEWKRGQLARYVLIHNYLRSTGSYSETKNRLARFFMRPRWLSTFHEAEAAASIRILPLGSAITIPADAELAERFRLAFKTLIYESWELRRSVATETVMDLECYLESGPRDLANGEVDIKPRDCDRNRECCLADRLRKQKEVLIRVRNAIPISMRSEDKDRREVLRQLIVHPKRRFERSDCQKLGDAFFAIFAPEDADILTTNTRDHAPLAGALGKTAIAPADLWREDKK